MDRPIRPLLLFILAALSGCSAAPEERKRPPPMVQAAPVAKHLFVDVLESEGTLRANEQVTIASAVTERIERVLFGDSMPVRRGQLLAVWEGACVFGWPMRDSCKLLQVMMMTSTRIMMIIIIPTSTTPNFSSSNSSPLLNPHISA